MLSAMEYPHWMMVAGAVLVVLGFIGFAFRKDKSGPVNPRTQETKVGRNKAVTIVEHAESFEVRSSDGQTVKQFPFDDNASRRGISGAMKKKQAMQAARTFAGKGAVLIASADDESSTLEQ